jgi:L-seryl-tRNA(Ser) seleniumtransferase
MITRRSLLRKLSAVPILGGLAGMGLTSGVSTKAFSQNILPYTRNLFKELGLRTFINVAGPITSMTGCLMPDEVLDTIKASGTQYVDLDNLQDKVGERIAELLDCEYATVSSGCFGAMTIAIAGVISGMDQKIVDQLPDTSGLKNEVILQESHMGGYCRALTNAGAKIVLIKTRKDLKQAINDKTAMLWFLNKENGKGEIKHEEWVEIGQKYGVPTFNDCASDIPPVENLFKYTKMGFDLVAFSGGKGLRGPQSAGLLLGKKKYIEAARLHTPPRANLGRGMKVNKEEILGMLVALEMYLAKDHDKEWSMWEDQIKLIRESVTSVEGVEAETFIPEIANQVPTLRISWDQSKIKITAGEVREKLLQGHPSIQIWPDKDQVRISTWMMEPGRERVVAHRLREVFIKNEITY